MLCCAVLCNSGHLCVYVEVWVGVCVCMCVCMCVREGKPTRRCAALHLIFLPDFKSMEKEVQYANREIHGLGNLND